MATQLSNDNMAIAQLLGDMAGSAILYGRLHAKEAGLKDLQSGVDPQTVLDRVVSVQESRIIGNSREHVRLVAMCAQVDYGTLQSAVDTHLLVQMDRFRSRLGGGGAQGSVNVGGSIEGQDIGDVLASWQAWTTGDTGGSVITDEERTWMTTTLPPLSDIPGGWQIADDETSLVNSSIGGLPDGFYNGVVLAPLPDDDYPQEEFFGIAETSASLKEAAAVAIAMEAGEMSWGESLQGGLDGH